MEDPAPQMDADFTAASIASAGLRGLADACVGPITHQLYFNATSACEHAVAGYAEVADALTRACALAVSAARSRMNATDKWLQSQVDEFEACSKQLEGMERHCLSVQFDEAQDTVFGAVRLLETSCFMPTRSININLLHSEAKLKPQTRCVLGVDASMSRVSHPAVMARGTVNTICVECIGVDGQAVHGLAPVDVQWRLISRGWSVKGGIQVVENTVFVSIRLKEECASAAELHLLIGGARFVIPLTVSTHLVCCFHEVDCVAHGSSVVADCCDHHWNAGTHSGVVKLVCLPLRPCHQPGCVHPRRRPVYAQD